MKALFYDCHILRVSAITPVLCIFFSTGFHLNAIKQLLFQVCVKMASKGELFSGGPAKEKTHRHTHTSKHGSL